MTTTSWGHWGRSAARVSIAVLASLSATACGPLEYCTPPACSLTPDTGPHDAAMDSPGDDTSTNDAGMDAGPTIPSMLGVMALPSGVCGVDGWCWLSPHGPPSAQWDDVASVGVTTEAWIVTDGDNGGATPGGAILHYDGTTWRGLIGLGARRVATTPSGDAWFLSGERDVFMWSQAMTMFTAPTAVGSAGEVFNDIGASDGDVWVVGNAGVVRRWDGMMWNRYEPDFGPLPGDLEAVFVASADDLWIGGAGGVVRHAHRNGTDWTTSPTVTTRDVDIAPFDVAAVWATADAMTVWVGGPTGARVWNAGIWQPPGGIAATAVTAIAGTSATEVYLLSSTGTSDYRAYNGVLSALDRAAGCTSSVASLGMHAYLRVGGGSASGSSPPGCASVLDDIRMPSPQTASTPLDGPFGRVGSVEPLLSGDHAGNLLVYATDGARVGDPATMTFGAVDAALVPDATTPPESVVIGASRGALDLFVDAADGIGTVLHRGTAGWTSVVLAPGLTGVTRVLFAVDLLAVGGPDTYAAAGDQVYHWDGTAFAVMGPALGDPIEQLAVVRGGVWAFHAGGSMLARLDGTWSEQPLGTSWDADCAPLVAQSVAVVECVGRSGRYRFDLNDMGAAGPVGTMTPPAPLTGAVVRALAGDRAWIFSADGASAAAEQVLWPVLDPTGYHDVWSSRSSGAAGGGLVRMLSDGTTWRVVDGSLLEWRPN